ncbi:hypothetical protein ABZ621_25070 [Streptomyces sp. NPDC007863]|uniref:hypothetical protein n=1 Tax=Streptomyces sp. NPDC007863 TaxID=3154894 RepID=UPI0033D7824D
MKPRTATATARAVAPAPTAVPAGVPTAVPARVPAAGDAADPHWWVPPVVATVLAPVVSCGAAAAGDLFTAVPWVLVTGFVLPLLVVAPGWFLARTVRRRRTRVRLAAAGCVLAAVYPVLLAELGFLVFVVMLLTGNVRS